MTGPARRRLAAPSVVMLPRVADSLSFLYLDLVRIVQDETGVHARIDTPRGVDRIALPVAALSCILLGPGTSITQPALATIARHGATVVCTGAGGVRSYAGILPDSLTTRWLEHQARAWADEQIRLRVAVAMYEKRFGTGLPPGTTLAQLRGLEGQRVKALYKQLAQQHRIPRFRRDYDPARWEEQDPVNLALSAANTCLYGIVQPRSWRWAAPPRWALSTAASNTPSSTTSPICIRLVPPSRWPSPCTPRATRNNRPAAVSATSCD
ncbi:type I-E CRISPR-associated endonuclease Cas1e [Crossiella sp. SN42]|uniref:type I-E CRISPR-associated endonuclease Cas1e n=1 Tax=Crossiella sp. SN42 TaxID=2944808 RepID=UPI00207CBDDB|nr:type I-E CRISPR-associated endonuclease Cas1e [Crossiella sp. SN42]MCO1575839.1 type I-E CRISPR-associated endonuclease Cas1e [Crossiella sp. SN42]